MAVEVVQVVSTNQTSVATDVETAMDAAGVDSDNFKDASIASFGANQFLVTVTYYV